MSLPALRTNPGVGHHNHGHFIRFLIWVDIATSYHLVMMVWKVMTVTQDPWETPSLVELLVMVFNFAACIPVWLCVGMFTWYHLFLVGTNTTTIERWEKDKVATLVRRGKIQEIKYPYVRGSPSVLIPERRLEAQHARSARAALVHLALATAS